MHAHGPKIEAGQILNPECFPPPTELVCVQVPKVFDQVCPERLRNKNGMLEKRRRPLPFCLCL